AGPRMARSHSFARDVSHALDPIITKAGVIRSICQRATTVPVNSASSETIVTTGCATVSPVEQALLHASATLLLPALPFCNTGTKVGSEHCACKCLMRLAHAASRSPTPLAPVSQ